MEAIQVRLTGLSSTKMDLSSTTVTHLTPLIISLYIIWQLLDRFIFSKQPKKSNDDLSSQLNVIQNNHLQHISADIKKIDDKATKISDEQIAQGNRLTRLETKLNIDSTVRS